MATEVKFEDITRDDFVEYETLRQSGVVSMWGGQPYTGLSKETYVAIMKHYTELNKKYPDVKSEVAEDAK